MIVEIILAAIAVGLVVAYFGGQYNEKYWKKRGVKFYQKHKFVGIFLEYLTGNRSMFEVLGGIYKEFENEPAVGMGSVLSPTLFVTDATNVTHVLQTEFNSFHHRGVENIEGDQLTESVVFLNGPKWKLMRQSMTPLFTSTKLKNMYYIMDKGAQDFVKYMKDNPKLQNSGSFNTMTVYCSAALIASVFGIGTESIFDSPFLKITRALAKPSIITNLKFVIFNTSPTLTRLLGIHIFSEHEKFFVNSIRQVMKQREEDGTKRHDFADVAVQIQKSGTLEDPSTGCKMDPTVGLLSAQAFFFFIAGVEPSAICMHSTLMELGRNPEVLRKVQKEIDEAFEANKELSFDVVSGMNYFEKVLSESMRKNPPIGYLTRQCTQDTVLPVGNIKVDKGTKVMTPIYHIHNNPKYYPNPEIFDPDRFTKDGQQPISDTFYMPFGRGNRTCIGARLARMQMKAGLVYLLRYFTPQTVQTGPLKYSKETLNVKPINVEIKFIPRDIKA